MLIHSSCARRLCWTGLSLASTVVLAAPSAPTGTGTLDVIVSEGKLVYLAQPAATVFVADPTIADVQVPQPDRLMLIGKHAGHTTLYALNADGRPVLTAKVEVANPTDSVDRQLHGDLPTSGVRTESTDLGVALRGAAVSPEGASRAFDDAQTFITKDKILDQTSVRGGAQVNLRVRIADVSRTVSKTLGINWNNGFKAGSFAFGLATGRNILTSPTGSGLSNLTTAGNGDSAIALSGATKALDLNAVIDALASESLVTILAEPNLTAMSGEPASFLSGGEFPIPIAQSGTSGGNNTITIQFKQYGVSLNFVPTVLSSNRISLHVRPEVSDLSTKGEVNLNGLVIPALTVRRADTTVELGSGESFVIGGLLENQLSTDNSRTPGLGDVPVLGALFRSSDYTRDQDELLIIVTPYLVNPIDDPNKVRLPGEAVTAPTDFELMMLGRVEGRPASVGPTNVTATATTSGDSALKPADPPRLVGDAGFDLR